LKQILSGILAILTSREKVKLFRLILFDLAIGLLDIAFLGTLLVIINFYTSNTVHPKVSFLPASLVNQNSLLLIGTFCLLFCIKNWFGFAGLKSQYYFFYEVASRLSKRNIMNYFRNDYLQYVAVDSSVYVRNISQQPIEFSSYILTNFQQVVSQIILIFFTICAILFYHPTLFLLLFLFLLPPVAALGWYIRRKLKDIRSQIKVTGEKTLQHLHESLAGYVESNIYGKNDFFSERFYQYQHRLDENIATQQTLQSLPSRLIEIFAVLGFFILVAVNKLSANAPAIDLLSIGIFMAAAYKIIPGIIKILNCTGQIKTYQFTINDLLLPGAAEPVNYVERDMQTIQSIKFERVYFKHNNQQVLNGVSFNLKRGDFAGLSAPSGRGKTTIVNLLLGFLEPGCGAVYLNDKTADIRERQTYRKRISYVKQQSFFIHDSILKNITLADNEYNREKLMEVICFCGVDQLLDKYPEGLEKIITENGKNISGGQRQRVMLARALYHDFDLLVLDEPFSEMDDHSEKEILQRLQLLAEKGKMILFITHKKESLSYCNKMILIDGQ
jgi:ABC-type bacteriocin/lantibiotic exporter with double-glycine peptidase domain